MATLGYQEVTAFSTR